MVHGMYMVHDRINEINNKADYSNFSPHIIIGVKDQSYLVLTVHAFDPKLGSKRTRLCLLYK